MRLRTFSSIGGLRILGNERHPSEEGFNSTKDFLEIRVRKEDLSSLAVGMIRAAGMDASIELIAVCQELVSAVRRDDDAAGASAERADELTAVETAWVKQLEENAGESKRETETLRQYYDRLVYDYGPPVE